MRELCRPDVRGRAHEPILVVSVIFPRDSKRASVDIGFLTDPHESVLLDGWSTVVAWHESGDAIARDFNVFEGGVLQDVRLARFEVRRGVQPSLTRNRAPFGTEHRVRSIPARLPILGARCFWK